MSIKQDAMAWSNANRFIKDLRLVKDKLTVQELRTLRGLALSGDIQGAEKGLRALLRGIDR